MSFLKNTNRFVLTTIIFSFLVVVPLAAGQGTGETGQEKDQKAAAEKAAADEKAKAESDAKNLVVAGVEPYVDPDKKGEIGDPNKLGEAGMGDRISVIVRGLSLTAKHKLFDPTKLALFVDGRLFEDVYPESVGYDCVVYKLERTPKALDAWNGLLGRPELEPKKPVVVSVGYADQPPLPLAEAYGNRPNLNLIVYRQNWALVALAGLIIIFFLFWKYGRTTLLRDSRPPNPLDGKLRPYSLAKVQVAWWFFIVIGSFLLIRLITGEFTMTEQALILIGIGTGTALGASMIDSSKRTSADNELETLRPQEARLEAELDLLDQQIADTQNAIAANAAATDAEKAVLQTDRDSLAAKGIERAEKHEKLEALKQKIADAQAGLQKPVSTGFWDDLVTDVDGPSFHRFQMIVWTVILGVLFLVGVYRDLAMPEFSGTMLALMGISAGTYLGFKVPERQTKGEQPADEASVGGAAAADPDELDGHDARIEADTSDEDLPITEGGVK